MHFFTLFLFFIKKDIDYYPNGVYIVIKRVRDRPGERPEAKAEVNREADKQAWQSGPLAMIVLF